MLFTPTLPRLRKHFIGAESLLQQRLSLWFQRAGGADAHALPAKDAGRVRHGIIQKGSDLGVEAAPCKVEGKGVLRILGADLHAAPTVNALVVVADVERVVIVNGRFAARAGKTVGVRAVLGQQFEDLWRFGQVYRGGEHFQDGTPAALYCVAVRLRLHAVAAWRHAGSRLHPPPGIYRTNAAQTIGREVGVVADNGDFDAQLFGGVEDGCPGRNSNFLAVNG